MEMTSDPEAGFSRQSISHAERSNEDETKLPSAHQVPEARHGTYKDDNLKRRL